MVAHPSCPAWTGEAWPQQCPSSQQMTGCSQTTASISAHLLHLAGLHRSLPCVPGYNLVLWELSSICERIRLIVTGLLLVTVLSPQFKSLVSRGAFSLHPHLHLGPLHSGTKVPPGDHSCRREERRGPPCPGWLGPARGGGG